MKVRRRSKAFVKYALARQRGGWGDYRGKIPRRRLRGAGFGRLLGKIGLSLGKKLFSIGKNVAKSALPDIGKAAVEGFNDVIKKRKSVKRALKDSARKSGRTLRSSAKNTLAQELKRYGI